MAYISQTEKAEIAPVVKSLLKKYGMKGSLSIRHHSTLVLTLTSGNINFGDATDVNVYYINEHFKGKAKEFLTKMVSALKGKDWYDRSDIQTDYFDTKHYVNIKVGKWDKPYQLIA